MQNLFNEIYLQDITKRNRVRNIEELEDLLNILSSAIGSLTNPEKLKNTFKTVKKSRITSATIKKYLDYFEDSFLIESAQRYDIKGKAYIETPKKYYFSDLGLRNARINFRQFEQTHSMENVIYNELRMRGYSVDVGVIPIAERNQEGKVIRKQLEVDFVCNLGSSRYYIQSAYSLPDETKRTQEIRPFRKIDDSFKNGLSWKIYGKDITDATGDIDFDVTVGADAGKSIPVDVINNVTGERSSLNLTLAYDGEFGFTATLTVNMESKNSIKLIPVMSYSESLFVFPHPVKLITSANADMIRLSFIMLRNGENSLLPSFRALSTLLEMAINRTFFFRNSTSV